MINNWLEIDGMVFDVVVKSIKETAQVLYSENTGRNISPGARIILDPLGTFYNHTIVVQRKGNKIREYDKLFNYITQPVYDGFHIKAVHNQTVIEYDAYVATVEREVHKIDDKNKVIYWKEMEISIIAMEAQVIPS